ncbi:MAG: OmpP1/FadL family transporter [Myxococcota bacterium]
MRGVGSRGLKVCILALGVLWARPAFAGGFEIPATGTESAGRGGAWTARADNAFAGWYNPAKLSALDGVDLRLSIHAPRWNSCYQRAGTYGSYQEMQEMDELGPNVSGTEDDLSRFGRLSDYADERFPEVCNEAGFGINPSLMTSFEVHDRIGLALGVVSPAGSGKNTWGSKSGVVEGVTGEERAAPSRYMQAFTDATVFRFVFAGGFELTPWLRLGAGFLWGMGFTDTSTYATPFAGERPGQDIRVDLRDMKDMFIPGAVASLHAHPLDTLELALSFQYSDDIKSEGRGRLSFADFATTTNTTEDGATVPSSTGWMDGVTLQVPQFMTLRFGARWALPRSKVPQDRAWDPMLDEVFDIALDVAWERNSRVDAFRVAMPENTIDIGVQPDFELTAPVPEETIQEKGFQDQVTVHLGGDYNVVPGRLALRTGFSFESNGYDQPLVQIDFQPGTHFGLHLGMTARFGGFELGLAYAHIFQKDMVVSEEDAALRQIVTLEPGAVINAGRYRNSWDLLSLGLAYRFN